MQSGSDAANMFVIGGRPQDRTMSDEDGLRSIGVARAVISCVLAPESAAQRKVMDDMVDNGEAQLKPTKLVYNRASGCTSKGARISWTTIHGRSKGKKVCTAHNEAVACQTSHQQVISDLAGLTFPERLYLEVTPALRGLPMHVLKMGFKLASKHLMIVFPARQITVTSEQEQGVQAAPCPSSGAGPSADAQGRSGLETDDDEEDDEDDQDEDEVKEDDEDEQGDGAQLETAVEDGRSASEAAGSPRVPIGASTAPEGLGSEPPTHPSIGDSLPPTDIPEFAQLHTLLRNEPNQGTKRKTGAGELQPKRIATIPLDLTGGTTASAPEGRTTLPAKATSLSAPSHRADGATAVAYTRSSSSRLAGQLVSGDSSCGGSTAGGASRGGGLSGGGRGSGSGQGSSGGRGSSGSGASGSGSCSAASGSGAARLGAGPVAFAGFVDVDDDAVMRALAKGKAPMSWEGFAALDAERERQKAAQAAGLAAFLKEQQPPSSQRAAAERIAGDEAMAAQLQRHLNSTRGFNRAGSVVRETDKEGKGGGGKDWSGLSATQTGGHKLPLATAMKNSLKQFRKASIPKDMPVAATGSAMAGADAQLTSKLPCSPVQPQLTCRQQSAGGLAPASDDVFRASSFGGLSSQTGLDTLGTGLRQGRGTRSGSARSQIYARYPHSGDDGPAATADQRGGGLTQGGASVHGERSISGTIADKGVNSTSAGVGKALVFDAAAAAAPLPADQGCMVGGGEEPAGGGCGADVGVDTLSCSVVEQLAAADTRRAVSVLDSQQQRFTPPSNAATNAPHATLPVKAPGLQAVLHGTVAEALPPSDPSTKTALVTTPDDGAADKAADTDDATEGDDAGEVEVLNEGDEDTDNDSEERVVAEDGNDDEDAGGDGTQQRQLQRSSERRKARAGMMLGLAKMVRRKKALSKHRRHQSGRQLTSFPNRITALLTTTIASLRKEVYAVKIREIETEERLNALLAASYEKRVAQARRTQAALTKMDYVAAKRAAASAYPRQMQGLAVKGKIYKYLHKLTRDVSAPPQQPAPPAVSDTPVRSVGKVLETEAS